MSDNDRALWDRRHAAAGEVSPSSPALFASIEGLFPTAGNALEIACGRGGTAVWLAMRGMEVDAVDVSPVAIDFARELAIANGVARRCRLDVWDLDEGLPPGPQMDLVICHMYRDPTLYKAMADRVAPGGLLAVAGLSEVGAGLGAFRATRGELRSAFTGLAVLSEGEGNGVAWLLGRNPE